MTKKTLAIYQDDINHTNSLIEQFVQQLPSHNVVAWSPDLSADYLLSWRPEPKVFATPGMKVVFALGAGVDAFLAAELPEGAPLVRLEEAGMGAQMLEMALYGILHYSRDMIALNAGRKNKAWLSRSTPKKMPFSAKIGVMGLGQLGCYIAEHLAQLGYSVSGYSCSLKKIETINCYDENGLDDFLSESEILINLLPLTSQTQGILNIELFNKMPVDSFLINLARGKHLIEEDLTEALDCGQLSGALLDVFCVEPLPKEHAFWCDERIIITPHLAAITVQTDAVEQISRNIRAFESGQKMSGVVNHERGY